MRLIFLTSFCIQFVQLLLHRQSTDKRTLPLLYSVCPLTQMTEWLTYPNNTLRCMLLSLNQDWYKIYFHVHTLQICVYGLRSKCPHLIDVESVQALRDHPMEQLDDREISQYETDRRLQPSVPDSLGSMNGKYFFLSHCYQSIHLICNIHLIKVTPYDMNIVCQCFQIIKRFFRA